jgi:hypothetical protein
MWIIVLVCLEVELALVQDRCTVQDWCTVCVKHAIRWEIILDVPDGAPRWRGSSGSSFRSVGRLCQSWCKNGDENINTIYTSTSTPSQTSLRPITRACGHQLNHQVSSFLSSCSPYLDHGNLCTFVLLRNNGKEPQGNIIREGWIWTAE